MAYNGSEYLLAQRHGQGSDGGYAVAARRLAFDKGREFMGVVDSWLREHAVLHTRGAYDPNANTLAEESIASRKRGTRCLLYQANVPVTLWPDAAEHTNEI